MIKRVTHQDYGTHVHRDDAEKQLNSELHLAMLRCCQFTLINFKAIHHSSPFSKTGNANASLPQSLPPPFYHMAE
jgi:hypothetical protein